MKWVGVLMALALLVAGCSSSAGSGGDTSAVSPPTVAAAAGPSNIIDHYDTATCADWKVTDGRNRRIVTTYFIVTEHADDLKDYEVAMQTAITVACADFPTVTIRRVVDLSIPELRKELGLS